MAFRDHRSPSAGIPQWGVALILAAVILLPLTFFTVRFVAAERTLYRADQLAYWTYSTGLAAGLTSHPVAAVAHVADSVANSELNLLPAVPIATSMVVLGPSRLAYVVSVLDIYGLAVILALVMALVTIRPEGSSPAPQAVFAGAASAILLLPGLWQPVFLGYLGLGGVSLCILILALYLRRDAADLTLLDLMVIGFLIALVAIFRRWYAFWSVALCAVILGESVAAAWRCRGEGRRRVLGMFRPAAVIGLSSVVTLAVLAAPVAARRLSGGYSEEFVGFASGGGVGGTLQAVVTEYGVLTLAVAAAALIGLVRRPRTRRMAAVIGFHLALTFTMMSGLQAHDPQHWYLYAAGLLVLMGSWIVRLLEGCVRDRTQVLASAVAIAMGLLVSAAVLLPIAAPVADAVTPVLPGLRVRPAVRQDLDEVARLMTELDAATTRRPGYIYVLGCTSVLSEQSLAFVNRSLSTEFSSPRWILQTAHVDRRDGFPHMLLEADYVVVPDPPQINLRPSEQQVVILPTTSFLEGTDVAKAYRRMPGEYHLDGGVRVAVFERVRPIRADEIGDLSARLREHYPDRPDIYSPE